MWLYLRTSKTNSGLVVYKSASPTDYQLAKTIVRPGSHLSGMVSSLLITFSCLLQARQRDLDFSTINPSVSDTNLWQPFLLLQRPSCRTALCPMLPLVAFWENGGSRGRICCCLSPSPTTRTCLWPSTSFRQTGIVRSNSPKVSGV